MEADGHLFPYQQMQVQAKYLLNFAYIHKIYTKVGMKVSHPTVIWSTWFDPNT